ncbi:MAG: hypothetical protein IV100_15560, partial [Myxococcales bacterium]|nr:hypothetical protein [Myxococcales bacterium]
MSKRHSPLLNRLVRAGVTVGLAASLATPGCKKDTPAPAATAVPATPPAPAPAAPVAPTAPADVAAPPAPPEAAPAPVAPAAPEAADAAAAPVPSPRTPLSPATLERRTGKVAATVIDAATLAPKGRQATGGAVYLSVPADRYVDGDPGDLTGRLTVLGDRAGVAVLTRPTDPGSSSWQILVRLTGDTLPEKVELDVAVGPARSRWNGYVAWKRGTIALGTISDAPEDKGLEKAFHEALATSLESQNNPFYAFAASRLRAMASGDKAATGGDFGGQAARSDLGDTMALYTGLTSIEESLQADRGLRLRGEAAEKRTLALDTITPVTAAAHDWPKLLEGRTPVIEPLARVVPADKLYMHFHDLRMAVRFGREVDEWLTPVLPIMEWRAGPTHLVEQLQTQLMIERTALSEALGNLAADGVAFVVGDPFIREGTDVSVVFKVKDQTLLNTSLAVYEAKARSEFGAELKDEAYEVRGKKVRHVYTADRVVDQHRIELGDVLIVSNSKAAIERFAAIADGAEKPLADSGDFQFMRARY